MDQLLVTVAASLGVRVLFTSVSPAVRKGAGGVGLVRASKEATRFLPQEEACATLRRDVRGKGGRPLDALRMKAPG